MLGTRNHPSSGQVCLWDALIQLLRVQAVSGWLSGQRPPRQGAPLVPGPNQPHRRPVQQFQAFSPSLTPILAPIPSLLPPKSAFVWETPHHEAFEQVIRELTNPRILANYKPGLPLRLETDAAQSMGLGMALWQQQPSGEWRILHCGSRLVTLAESRYSATEGELLAAVWAVHKAHLHLAGADFELVVDHRRLISILNSKSLDELPSPRLVRLKEKLALYQLIAVLRPGIEHKTVDCFSRSPVDDPDVDNE